ncbi:alpha-galactosidase [Spirochaetia bacterium]|nr:alpha-galactosidase [Spirochaetia bacterium]
MKTLYRNVLGVGLLALAVGCTLSAVGCSSSAAAKEPKDYGEFIPLTGKHMTETEYNVDNVSVRREGNRLVLDAGAVRIDYDLAAGTADLYRLLGSTAVENPVLTGVFAETEIAGRKIASSSLRRSDDSVYIEDIDAAADPFGAGVKVSVRNTGDDISLWQNFYAYTAHGYVLLELVVESAAGTASNYLAPIAAGNGSAGVLSIDPAKDPRFLFVPWDNDGFIRYRSDRLLGASESYGVTAVFDNDTRRGFVTGAVTHDTWKTGIRAKTGGKSNSVTDFRVFGGIATKTTRDTQPHGSLEGHQIYSPKMFFGFYDDWRDGMEEFGKACGTVAPPLPWNEGSPFGWNSWSAVAEKLTYDVYTDSADFVKDNLVPKGFNNNGVVYINFDSYWGTDLDAEIRKKAAVKYVTSKGLRAGTYGGFYSYWGGDNFTQPVEGTNGKYNYMQVLLKDKNGKPLPPVDGARALDPTHPGTIMRSKAQLDEWIDYGFSYAKLDFMAHGAIEGEYYNKDIKTGVQAYNYGMKQFLDYYHEKFPKGDFFLSLSIAPMFPSQYAQARRVSCDAFGAMDSSEYLLNSLSYGWWLHKNVYTFNDADHISVYNSFNHRDPTLYNEGLTRYLAAVISGGIMLNSDDFRQSEARDRVKQILGNTAINALAASGKTFRPVEGNTGDKAVDQFVRNDGDAVYVALFNYSTERTKKMTVNFARAGLDVKKNYRMLDMVTNKETSVSGSVEIELAAAEPKLLKFY